MDIRAANATDVIALAALEQACFPADPWSEHALKGCITEAECPTLVLVTEEGALRGYVTGRMLPPEAELYRICIHPDARGRGYGRELLAAFHTKLTEGGCDTCYLEVRASNTAARALYRAIGYAESGVRKNYYRAPVEDAVIEVIKLED